MNEIDKKPTDLEIFNINPGDLVDDSTEQDVWDGMDEGERAIAIAEQVAEQLSDTGEKKKGIDLGEKSLEELRQMYGDKRLSEENHKIVGKKILALLGGND